MLNEHDKAEWIQNRKSKKAQNPARKLVLFYFSENIKTSYIE